MDGRRGAVGFVSVLFPSVYPVALLKVDEETKEIVRDANGLCVICRPGKNIKQNIAFVSCKYCITYLA